MRLVIDETEVPIEIDVLPLSVGFNESIDHPPWKPLTDYLRGDFVYSDGFYYYSLNDRTSGETFEAEISEWFKDRPLKKNLTLQTKSINNDLIDITTIVLSGMDLNMLKELLSKKIGRRF